MHQVDSIIDTLEAKIIDNSWEFVLTKQGAYLFNGFTGEIVDLKKED